MDNGGVRTGGDLRADTGGDRTGGGGDLRGGNGGDRTGGRPWGGHWGCKDWGET